jgi:hypothetical protein
LNKKQYIEAMPPPVIIIIHLKGYKFMQEHFVNKSKVKLSPYQAVEAYIGL